MKQLVLTAAVAGTAIVIAGCSASPSTPKASASGDPSPTASPVSRATCSQQYQAWSRGPAQRLIAATKSVDAATTARNIAHLRSALKNVGVAITEDAADQIPSCADPGGYWNVVLMHMSAAAQAVSPGSRVKRWVAIPALSGVVQLEQKLKSELAHTTTAS